jgi:prepilin-type N-terminal cleavage/methylation domain-containing protein
MTMTRYPGQSCSQPGRGGFSLIELIIVVAVLVTIASIAAPSFMERVREGQVQDAAETVREVVAEARTFAIDSGVDYHVRFEPGGRWIVAIPAEREPGAGNSLDQQNETADFKAWANQVPETILLQNAQGDNSGGESLEPADFNELANSGELAQKSWSSPILFRFDGSAEDREFRVMDAEGRSSSVTVRGLTGAVRVSPVFIMEDEP